MASQLEKWLVQTLRELKRFKVENLVNKRYERLRTFGKWMEATEKVASRKSEVGS
jgi:acetyl-CoA carboxylase alpha subunit